MSAVPMLAGVGLLSVCCISSSVASTMMGGGDGNGADSSSPTGNGNGVDSSPTVKNALEFEIGTPIQCTANDVGSGANAAVYRYMGGTELRHYPNPPIATSWDPDWSTTFKKIDCAGLTEGKKMPHNVQVGDPVQCTTNDVGSGANRAVYRVEEGEILRHYPNPPIATSWDPDWSTTFKRIDCVGFTQGDAIAMKP